MAKNIRALRKGGKVGVCQYGPTEPNSPYHVARSLKGESLPREKRAVILHSSVDAIVGKRFTARKRRKVLAKLRRVRSTVTA